jgi:hypothetical protein
MGLSSFQNTAMKTRIESALHDPISLELLFRENNDKFKAAFNELYPTLQHHPIADCWNARLNYQSNQVNWGTKNEILVVLLLSFLAGLAAKIPAFFKVDDFLFYSKNIGFIAFPFVIAYFVWKKKPSKKTIVGLFSVTLISVLFINLMPLKKNTDSYILSCIHLPLLMWSLLGISFTGNQIGDNAARVRFLRFNGDMAVVLNMLSLAFFALSAITIGLFEAIQISIGEIYLEYIGIWSIAASPVLASFIIESNPKLVNKISPIIAKIFSPLVLLTLIVYLATLLISGNDPFKNREFLIVFNMLLIGVLAIIFFSVSASEKSKFSIGVLLGLSLTTILVNLTAVAAILYRITTWGITPNRSAVLGSNLLILINLVLVSKELLRCSRQKGSFEEVEFSITRYLPVYVIWMAVVGFLFPLIFGFR